MTCTLLSAKGLPLMSFTDREITVLENITISAKVTISGDVNIILRDDLTFTANDGIRIPAGCASGEFPFDDCPHVYVFSVPGGGAEQYCRYHDNCAFVEEDW